MAISGVVPKVDLLALNALGELGSYFASFATTLSDEAGWCRRFSEDLVRVLGPMPVDLKRRLECARWDKVRDAQAIAAVALRFGGRPQRSGIEPAVHTHAPTLFELAMRTLKDLAVRGTYRSLVCACQGASDDAEIASVMSVVAEHESAWAQLGWELTAWFETRLIASERAALVDARFETLAEIRGEAMCEPSPALVTIAGLPPAVHAQALLTLAEKHLLAA
jgi:hypothetical protein